MAVIELNYGDIVDARKQAEKVAKKCEDYKDEIQKKVVTKLGKLTLGASKYTESASAFAQKKMAELESKESAFMQYARRLDDVVYDPMSGAKAVDERVRDTIEREYQWYKKMNGIKVNPIYEGLCNLFTRLFNSNGFLKILKESFNLGMLGFRMTWDDIRYWYKCEGGKEIVKIVAGVVIAVAAVVVAVLAWPVMVAAISAGAIWASIAAIASFVGACIAVCDALVNLYHEGRALWNIRNNRPADACWDSRTDKLTDWLNRTVSDKRWVNQITTGLSQAISVIEFTCAVIGIVDMGISITKFAGGMKKAYAHGGWDTVFKNIKKKTINKFTTKDGKVTFKSFKDGLSATKKYLDRITKNRDLRTIERNLELDNSLNGLIFQHANSANEKIEPFKITGDFATTTVDEGLGDAVTQWAIDRTHGGETVRSALETSQNVRDNINAIHQIRRNSVY